MSDEFSIQVKSVKLEYEPAQQTVIPTSAAIRLTISGLPVIIWPCIWPDSNGRLRLLQPRDHGIPWAWTEMSLPKAHMSPYDRGTLNTVFAWEREILPALAKHLGENWSEDEARKISVIIDKIAYAVCSEELSNLDWQDEYKLSSSEQRGAAAILEREGGSSLSRMKIRVDRGHAAISDGSYTIASMPITSDIARRVIEADRNMQDGLISYVYPQPERMAVLIGAIMSAHPALNRGRLAEDRANER